MAVQLASGALKSRVGNTNQWNDAIIAIRTSDVAVSPTAPTGTEKVWFDTDDTEEVQIPEMSDHLTLAGAMAVVVNGKQSTVAAAENDYVILQNSEITDKSDGIYLANKTIPADTDLDGTYLKTDSGLAKGAVNYLKSSLDSDSGIYRRILTSSDDLNSIVDAGSYDWINNSMPTNRPSNFGSLFGHLTVIVDKGNQEIAQIAWEYDAGKPKRISVRRCLNSSWGSWSSITPPLSENLSNGTYLKSKEWAKYQQAGNVVCVGANVTLSDSFPQDWSFHPVLTGAPVPFDEGSNLGFIRFDDASVPNAVVDIDSSGNIRVSCRNIDVKGKQGMLSLTYISSMGT